MSTAAQASVMASGGGAAAGSGLVATGAVGSGAGVLAGHIEPAASVSASLGKAGAVGALSVPPSWTTVAPTAGLLAAPSITLAAEPIWTGMPASRVECAADGAAQRARRCWPILDTSLRDPPAHKRSAISDMSTLTGPSEQDLCLCGSESDSVIRQASSALLPQVCARRSENGETRCHS